MKKTLCLAALAALMINTGWASTNAYVEGGERLTDIGGFQIAAMSFTVKSAIIVTHLGFCGLALSGGDTPNVYLHNVDASTTIASCSWAAGVAQSGVWTYKECGSITLYPGTNYQVSAPLWWRAVYSNDQSFTFGSSINTNEVTWYRQDGASGWYDGRIATTRTDNPNTAMNFIYVPEPGMFVVMSVLSLCGFRRIARGA
ncbi:MAG: hypothetical protein NTV22_19715 [bacterium]|nr:hypothetical protein [bacterium]